MARNAAILLLCFVLCTILSGCWNRRELNELAICVGLGLDKAEGGYQVTVQLVNPGEVASKKSSTRAPVITFTEKGTTVFEAFRRMTTFSPRKIYFSHLRTLIIGEELARSGISEALDIVTRDHEFRSDFYVVVAKHTSASKVLEVLTTVDKIPAIKLFSSLTTSQKVWAPTATVKLDELITDLTSMGKQAVLSTIEIVGKPEQMNREKNADYIAPPTQLKYTGLGVFKSDKLIGWLGEQDSKSYNFIVNKVENTVVPLNCPDGGVLTLEAIRTTTQIKGYIENNQPKAKVIVRLEDNVSEVECHFDLTKPENIEQLQQIANEHVKSLLGTTIQKVQSKYQVDIFGFGEAIHRADPKMWTQLKEDWDQHFSTMEVIVESDVRIRRLGTVNNSFLEKLSH
ncbi:Ger(x)C family spore germination protein [Paenibacillus sp. y28]|uniref:Ger(x)C family spore germination protein n=1 Tax=Paenibacillus sp. y28 TaxID=3129110 RepID=UPI00301631DB